MVVSRFYLAILSLIIHVYFGQNGRLILIWLSVTHLALSVLCLKAILDNIHGRLDWIEISFVKLIELIWVDSHNVCLIYHYAI